MLRFKQYSRITPFSVSLLSWIIISLVIFFLLILLFWPKLAFSQQQATPTGRSVLVKVKPDVDEVIQQNTVAGKTGTGLATLDIVNQTYGIQQMEPVFPFAGKFEPRHRSSGLHLWYRVVIPTSRNIEEALLSYKQDPNVEKAEANHERRLIRGEPGFASPKSLNTLLPDDPRFDVQWHYNNTGQQGGTADADIDLPEAWTINTGYANVVVQILDTGADLSHPDLRDNIWTNSGEIPDNGIDDDNNGYVDDIAGWDFSDRDNKPDDSDGHGSHIAGTVAASTHNSTGVSGIAGGFGGNGVKVMPCKIFENATDDIIAEAFVYGADNGAVISSNSWGGGPTSSIIENAIDYFIANAGGPGEAIQGGVVVFAAGNDDSSDPSLGYPASYEPVIAVAATDRSDRKASFSSYGTWVDISAPGVDIVSTVHNGGYDTYDGTSMACPHVAGVAALMASHFYGITTSELQARMPGVWPD